MEINLSRGLVATVDASDFDFLSSYTWHASKSKSAFYASTTQVDSDGKKQRLTMHRLIMNPPKNLTVDHINGNTLDNRRENLRIATMQENSWNKTARSSSGFLGVRKAGNSWLAIIFPNLHSLSLGTYKTKEVAAAAFNEAAKIIYGDFAKLNDVPNVSGLIEAEISKREKTIARLQKEISLLRGWK